MWHAVPSMKSWLLYSSAFWRTSPLQRPDSLGLSSFMVFYPSSLVSALYGKEISPDSPDSPDSYRDRDHDKKQLS